MTDSQTPSSQVDVRRDGRGVAYVTIANERRMNSLNSDLMREFIEKVQDLGRDDELRVVVVTGAGDRAFSGGANVFEMADFDRHKGRAFITLVHGISKAVRDLPVPVIARINGLCFGAGLELAASCDMRVAVEGALLGMPEVEVGLPSVVEAALFPQLIGWGRTKQLIYTAENIDAREALEWGLVEKVVPQAELDAAVEKWVAAIVKAGPRAIRLQRELIREWEAMPVNDAIQAGIRNFARACETDEPYRLLGEVVERLRSKRRGS